MLRLFVPVILLGAAGPMYEVPFAAPPTVWKPIPFTPATFVTCGTLVLTRAVKSPVNRPLLVQTFSGPSGRTVASRFTSTSAEAALARQSTAAAAHRRARLTESQAPLAISAGDETGV